MASVWAGVMHSAVVHCREMLYPWVKLEPGGPDPHPTMPVTAKQSACAL